MSSIYGDLIEFSRTTTRCVRLKKSKKPYRIDDVPVHFAAEPFFFGCIMVSVARLNTEDSKKNRLASMDFRITPFRPEVLQFLLDDDNSAIYPLLDQIIAGHNIQKFSLPWPLYDTVDCPWSGRSAAEFGRIGSLNLRLRLIELLKLTYGAWEYFFPFHLCFLDSPTTTSLKGSKLKCVPSKRFLINNYIRSNHGDGKLTISNDYPFRTRFDIQRGINQLLADHEPLTRDDIMYMTTLRDNSADPVGIFL